MKSWYPGLSNNGQRSGDMAWGGDGRQKYKMNERFTNLSRSILKCNLILKIFTNLGVSYNYANQGPLSEILLANFWGKGED